MANENASIWLTGNGEIYNFLQLKEICLKKGHRFSSATDMEVIIHLYEDLGEDCLKLLRGMFAFCIWDENKKRLFLARDRVGKKPLSYYYDSKIFAFASEIKSILQIDTVPHELDLESMHHYLTYGYVPSPRTMFQGIKKIPPGHYLVVDKNGLRANRYWKLSYERKDLRSEAEYCERILDLLKESVKIRMISDVPLGAFLSGGIDSSAVVALMSEFSHKPVKTFSIGFEDQDYSELSYARLVAKRFGTDHHEFIVKPDAISILPKLIWYYNEPFADSSCIPTYYLCKITRDYVTVALNGDGGDESFAGYQRYRAIKLSKLLNNMPSSLIKSMLLIQKTFNRLRGYNEKGYFKYAENFLDAVLKYPDLYKRYIRWMVYFENHEKEALYTKELKDSLCSIDSCDFLLHVLENSDAEDIVEKSINSDVLSYLPEDLLVKVDIASMANSLEARSPFLDHILMECVAQIPINIKMKGFSTKYLLKKALSKLLPKDILYRRKMGFGVPVGRWFRNEMKDFLQDVLLSRTFRERGLFNTSVLEKMLNDHLYMKRDYTSQIWALLNLELWFLTYLKGSIIYGKSLEPSWQMF